MRRGVLPSGLTLICVQRPDAPQTSIRFAARAGTRYEQDYVAGSSHMLEHLLFHGTHTWSSSLEFHRHCDDLAIELNAMTCRDAVTIEADCVVDNTVHALRVLRDMTMYPSFDAADLELERNVVAEEILGDYTDEGECYDLDTLSRAALLPEPMCRPICGTLDDVEKYDLESLYRLHQQIFVGGNCVLVLVSPLDEHELYRVTERVFSTFPPGERLVTPTPQVNDERDLIVCGTNDAQNSLQLTFAVPPGQDLRAAATFTVLSTMLSHGFSAPLRYELIEHRGLAYAIDVSYDDHGDVAFWDLSFSCAPSKLNAAAQCVMEVLDTLSDCGPAPADLRRGKDRLRFNQIRSTHAPEAQALELAWHELSDVPYTVDELQAACERVTADDVRECVQNLTTPLTVLTGPVRRTHRTTLNQLWV